MTPVWIRLRAESRRRARSLLALAVLIGLASGFVIAAFAGARRTATAYPRFAAEYDEFEVLVDPAAETPRENEEAFEKVRKLEIVERSSVVSLIDFGVVNIRGRDFGFPDIFVLWSDNDEFLNTFHRFKLVHGRRADPEDPTEGEIPLSVADRFGLRVGDTVTVKFGGSEDGPPVTRGVRIVGIGATPGSFEPSSGSYFPFLFTSRNLVRDAGVPVTVDPVLLVDLRGDADGVEALREQVRALDPSIDTSLTLEPQTEAVRRSSRFQVSALQSLGVLAALAAIAILGQAIVRMTLSATEDAPILAAIGMTRRQLLLLALARAAVVGLAAALIGVGVAIALSPATPIGPMRIAEPDPGVFIDRLALAVGAAVTLIVVVLLALPPALRISSAVRRARARDTQSRERIPSVLSRTGAPPTVTAGVGAAFARGGGATSVPVATTLAGAVIAVAALVAALVFGASLAHLVQTPRLSGYGWDAMVAWGGPLEDLEQKVRAIDEVEAVGLGGGPSVVVGGVEMPAFIFASGDVRPSIAIGRAPATPDEIALGPATLRRLHADIGDVIRVDFLDFETDRPGNKGVPMRIVGKSVTPTFFFSVSAPGEGAVITAGAASENVDGFKLATVYVRFDDGIAVDDGVHRLNETLGTTFLIPRRQSSDLANLDRVSGLPYVLAILLACMGLGALAHMLLASVRRRRKELSVLKTLGFVRRQVAATVVWQTSTLVLVALVIGIPAGIAAGRWAWLAFADQLGFVPEAVVPLLATALTVPLALLAANVIAAVPARAAAAAQPAQILRTE